MGFEKELVLRREKLGERFDFEGSQLYSSEVSWLPIVASCWDFECEYSVDAEVKLKEAEEFVGDYGLRKIGDFNR